MILTQVYIQGKNSAGVGVRRTNNIILRMVGIIDKMDMIWVCILSNFYKLCTTKYMIRTSSSIDQCTVSTILASLLSHATEHGK